MRGVRLLAREHDLGERYRGLWRRRNRRQRGSCGHGGRSEQDVAAAGSGVLRASGRLEGERRPAATAHHHVASGVDAAAATVVAATAEPGGVSGSDVGDIRLSRLIGVTFFDGLDLSWLSKELCGSG